jgi:excinuclease ABC subunit A
MATRAVLLLASPARGPPGIPVRPPALHHERFECPTTGTCAPTPTPQLFSFNNPRGACPTCNGFGATLEYDEALIVPDPERSLRDGALDPWTKPRYENKRIASPSSRAGAHPAGPRRGASSTRHASQRCCTRQGQGLRRGSSRSSRPRGEEVQAVHPRVPAAVPDGAMDLRGVRRHRLRPEALGVRVGGRTIAEVAGLPVGLLRWDRRAAARPSRAGDRRRTSCARRAIASCSSSRRGAHVPLARPRHAHALRRRGPAHRPLQLAGRALVDALYVLDEPSIGFIRATSTACSRCSGGCAMRATRC